jgi:hypothetical protein
MADMTDRSGAEQSAGAELLRTEAPEQSPPTEAESSERSAPALRKLPAGGGAALFTLIATSSAIALLAFGFSFGNVWNLNLRLRIPGHIAPLIGPAVDLSVVGLLVTVQWLSLAGASAERLKPARRLLFWCGVATLGLNSALSVVEGAYGRATVEAIAPLLLIAWSHVGPAMLRLFVELRAEHAAALAAEQSALAGGSDAERNGDEKAAPEQPKPERRRSSSRKAPETEVPRINARAAEDADYLRKLRKLRSELGRAPTWGEVKGVVGGGDSRVKRFVGLLAKEEEKSA